MKAILHPKFSALSPHLPKTGKTSPFALFSRDSVSDAAFRNNPTRISNDLHLKSTPFSTQNRNLHMEAGEIHVIVGPLFAGKTTTLLRRIQLESRNGRSVAIIKSSKDTRYGLDSIVTHDGVKLPCWATTNLSSFKQKFGLDAYEQMITAGCDWY